MMSGLPIALLVTMVALVTGRMTHVISTQNNPPTSAITNPSKTNMAQANSAVLGIMSGGTKLLKTTVSLSPSTTSSHELATSTDSIVLSELSSLSQGTLLPASPSISVTKSSSYDSKTSLLAQRSLSMSVRSSPVNSIMASMLSSVYSSSIQTLPSTFFSTAYSSSVIMELGITPLINPPADKSSTETISSKLDVKSMSSVDSHVTSQASNTTLTTRSKTNNASVSVNATSTSVFMPTTTVTSISNSPNFILNGTSKSILTEIRSSSKSLSMVNTTLIMETASMFITSTSMVNPRKRSFDVVSTTVFSKDVVNSTLTSFVNMVKPTATSSVFNSSVMLVRKTTMMPLPTANVTSDVTMVHDTVTSYMVKATRMGNTTMTSLAIVDGTITSTQVNVMVNATVRSTRIDTMVNGTITRSQVNVAVNATVTTTTANDMMSVASLAGRTSVTLIPVLSIKTTTVAIETTTMRSVTAVTTSVRLRASSSVKAFFRTNSSSLTSQLRTSSLILPISTSTITSHSSKLMSKPSTSKPPSLSSSTTVIPQTVNQKFRLTIEGDCKEVQNDNSSAFEKAVKTSISMALGIDRSQVKVLSIDCGSIIVDIEIKSVPKDNITKRFTEAVNSKQLKIDYKGKRLAVTSVSTITAKPRDDDDDTAFIIYIVLGTVMGVAFLIAVVALIIRCQRERSAGMFHLPNEEHLELSGFSRNNKSHLHQGNFYGDLEMESGDPEFRARSSEPDIVPYGDDTMNGGTDVTPNVGYLPEWKSLTKLDLSEAGHAGDQSASGNNLLLTYGNKNTEKESEVVGSNDSFKSYDNPSVE